MADPRVVPRAEHPISRRDIDPDALKVLYRLRQADHIAYLVGGSVRDLVIGRRPKDFDIGTSAHPYQIKKLFRNCWIIGRRFRLAHVRFGTKVIEVATFRRPLQPGEEPVAAPPHAVPTPSPDGEPGPGNHVNDVATATSRPLLQHRDNTFGTPEEDAFRRDFTINALFYDIATFAIIDYVGGMEDLQAGVVRSIGEPEVRFQEDPVRMLRAVALAARLDFVLDPPVLAAIRANRHEIRRASAPRLLEEYYKILRSGYAEKTFRSLDAVGLLEPVTAELHAADEPLWLSLAALDSYRRNFPATPETFTNPVLLGSVLVPLELPALLRPSPPDSSGRHSALQLGELPLGRRDVEQLRQLLGLQRRLRDRGASVRAQRALTHRSIFRDALTWLEVHGGAPDVVEHWITVLAERGAEEPPLESGDRQAGDPPPSRRRRRRRRRYRPTPGG